MSVIESISVIFPQVKRPTVKKVSFKTKLKWTLIVLISFFVLSLVPLFGVSQSSYSQFQYFSLILGASFGYLLTLGIGPIVTASIVLQLLVGSGILKFDLTSEAGKKKFQSYQKVFSIAFIVIEALIYVLLGAVPAANYYNPATHVFKSFATGATVESGFVALSIAQHSLLQFLVILQLCVGGFIVMYLDELMTSWGFGSGISLFIAAGISQQIMIRAFAWWSITGIAGVSTGQYAPGAVLALFQAFQAGDSASALNYLLQILATIVVFVVAVYAQAMKIEIPLSFERVRGYGIRWPLNFLYTSNIPVILTAALFANIQVIASLTKSSGIASTISSFFNNPGNIQTLFETFSWAMLGSIIAYIVLMVVFSTLFSLLWVNTSQLDPKSQAKQIMASGLQVPGFRKDQRVLERLLSRYIWPLSFMGGIAIGLLAALADITNALSRGTGILLTVMIIYQFYESIVKEHLMDMNPAFRKFVKA